MTVSAISVDSTRAGRRTVVLAAATIAFFVVTLDAVIVNVALPRIGTELQAGIPALQWVVDGYTLMFASLLLTAGVLSDRLGASRALIAGMALFVLTSVACGLAPTAPALVAARFVQGAAAAGMMPASMALIGHAYPQPRARAGAVAVWAMGGAIASSAGPVLGGLLTVLSWRLIFFVNLPVGVIAVLLLLRADRTPTHDAPFDLAGQMTGLIGMCGLTFGVIEAGRIGFAQPLVETALAVAVAALAAFVMVERRSRHPMVPFELFRTRNAAIPVVMGFAFMAGYYGLPFVMSLYLQQVRGLSALATGMTFLPMMLIGLVFTPFSARLAARFGARLLILTGLVAMTAGLALLAVVPARTPEWVLAALMVLVGLAGPFVMPPTIAVLMNSVPASRGGVVSGVFNTSRQVGGALAVAVFGALLAQPAGLEAGRRISVGIAAAVALLAATTALLLNPGHPADNTKGAP